MNGDNALSFYLFIYLLLKKMNEQNSDHQLIFVRVSTNQSHVLCCYFLLEAFFTLETQLHNRVFV